MASMDYFQKGSKKPPTSLTSVAIIVYFLQFYFRLSVCTSNKNQKFSKSQG